MGAESQSSSIPADALPGWSDNRRLFRNIANAVRIVLVSPLLALYAVSNQRGVLRQDVAVWFDIVKEWRRGPLLDLLHLLGKYPEFRTLFYYRLQSGNAIAAAASLCFALLYRGQTALHIWCPKIGPGLFLQHSFSTVIAAKKIGKHCWINQQVTVGYTSSEDSPIIGDNVTIGAGAKVLGAVRIGDRVTIGANAVVVKDVPDDCVVVGVPARIVRRNGVRVSESL